jgi:peptidoglycan/LPS O-acetylase OafA/YrhL
VRWHHTSHRTEIDGLRAVAVLAVLFYHFSVPGFGGGFVGVDIFFVISGYLIGGILWRELSERGTISLSAFYIRRIKRLAPAFIVVAFTTLVAGYFVLLPFEFRELGKSLIAATFYLSNVHFFREEGYFAGAADQKILLHTWSLSVEEQFYILIPALMFLLARYRAVLLAVLCLIFIASLAMCIVVTPISNTAAFYLFPFRAWAMLAGVLLAIYRYEGGRKWQYTPAISWAGLAILVASIAFIKPGPSFPGVQAVWPTLGALLILANGRNDNSVNRVLSSRAAIFFGLISYSLYLWHWPVLTLSRYYLDGRAGTPIETNACLFLVIALAWASWRFVEQPFRTMHAVPPLGVFAGAALSSAILLTIGGAVYWRNGMPERFDASIRVHIDASSDFVQDWSRCQVPASGPWQGISVCLIGPGRSPTFLIWGDSHVRAFKEGLALLAEERGSSGLLIWRAGCPPLFDIRKRESATTRLQDTECTEANIRIRRALAQTSGIEDLLLIGRWAYYAEGVGTGYDVSNTISLMPKQSRDGEHLDQREVFSGAVDVTINELSRKFNRVFVMRQVPEVPFYDSRNVARSLVRGNDVADEETIARLSVPVSDVESRVAASERPFARLAVENKIIWLDPWDQFCTDGRCSAVIGARSYYFDNNHITNFAAKSIRHIFEPLMEKMMQGVAAREAR